MRRLLYLGLGFASVAVGALGVVLPLLPTVPFMLLAAFFFARSSPRLEAWIVDHPRFGPHVKAWRERGAIGPAGKRAALVAFAISAVLGLVLLPIPWLLAPIAAALVGGSWIATRPEA
ncbi:MAG TPA: YbaN family protein [Allosphingosinicella sp.]|nr:YbaN family protein [Allosphingosinicella sp.]